VRLPYVCATLVAGPLSIFIVVGTAAAQQPGAPAGPRAPLGPPPSVAPASTVPAASQPHYTSVAIVDIGYIFKNYAVFDAEMKQLKNDFDQADAMSREEQRKLQVKKDEMANFNPTSAEYKKREEELSRAVAELQIKLNGKKKELAEQEAGIYYRVYKSVEQEVAIVAQQNRIDLVFRYSADEMKADNPNSIMQGVSKPIVYHANLDITGLVIDRLNRRQPAASPGAGPAIRTANPGAPIVPGRPTQR
jgi:Skp family chaperone for outer membrane proteins